MSENAWKPFRDSVEAPWERARAWKENTGCKVVGHLLPDVPEEMIHAVGALPWRLKEQEWRGLRLRHTFRAIRAAMQWARLNLACGTISMFLME